MRGALHGIDDLLDQYIAIVKARRQLLDADRPGLACKFDLGRIFWCSLSRCIGWMMILIAMMTLIKCEWCG